MLHLQGWGRPLHRQSHEIPEEDGISNADDVPLVRGESHLAHRLRVADVYLGESTS